MAMKGKGGAASGGVLPVYKDFKPISEWQQDAHSHDLLLFLPGFMKEKLGVSTESPNIIRVRGERLLSGNQWSRFLEDFEVPENSNMDLARAKFHEGTLTITIPKKSVDKPNEFTPEKKGVGTNPNEKRGNADDDRSKETSSSKQKHAEIERTEAEKKTTVAKEERKPERSTKLGEDENHEMTRKTTEGEKKTTVAKEERKSERSKELGKDKNHEMTGKMKLKRDDGAVAAKGKSKEGKRKEVVESSQADHGAFTKAVKGVAGLNEERQLMVNMGAAVLVIAAFSAYVTYKFVAGDDKK